MYLIKKKRKKKEEEERNTSMYTVRNTATASQNTRILVKEAIGLHTEEYFGPYNDGRVDTCRAAHMKAINISNTTTPTIVVLLTTCSLLMLVQGL